MEGYVYQSVCVVTGSGGEPVLGVPDAESAAVVAARLGEGAGIVTVPVVNLPWFPVQPEEPREETDLADIICGRKEAPDGE